MGIQEAKVAVLDKLGAPKDKGALRALLGFLNYYRRFIPNFSKRAHRLNQLLREGQAWKWGPEEEQARRDLLEAIKAGTVLQLPRRDLPFTLYTDWSSTGMGAVLCQEVEGEERVVAYASRSCTATEANYSSYEGEGLATVWGVTHFRAYLQRQRFTLITDHQPLLWLMTNGSLTGRNARWAMRLQEYDFIIKHRAGKTLQHADGLSRNPPPAVEQQWAAVAAEGEEKGDVQELKEQKAADIWLRTSLCLQVRAEQFAAGAISLAAKFLKVKLPGDGDKPWWADFHVTPKTLEDVSVQLLELYEQVRLAPAPTHPAATTTAPSASAASRGSSRGAPTSLSHPPLASATTTTATTTSSAPLLGKGSSAAPSDSHSLPGGGGTAGGQGGGRRHSDGEREKESERGGHRESDGRRERIAAKGRDGRANGSVGGGEMAVNGDGGRNAGEAGAVEERGGRRQSGGVSGYGSRGGDTHGRGRDGTPNERDEGGRRGSGGSSAAMEEEDGEIGEWSGGNVEEPGSAHQEGRTKGARGNGVDEEEGAEGRGRKRWGGEEEMEYAVLLDEVDVGARGPGGERGRARAGGRSEWQEQESASRGGSGEKRQQVRARLACAGAGAARDGWGSADRREEEGEVGEAGEIGEAGEVSAGEGGRADGGDDGVGRAADGRSRRSGMDLNRAADEPAARSSDSRAGGSSRAHTGGAGAGAASGRADQTTPGSGEEHRGVQRGGLRRGRDGEEAGDDDDEGGQHRHGGEWGRHKKARMET
ncbi:hypothetical protein CLOP_g23415 [Closterium sp. NIES-67]|nr:hypothetical protein CLOP_g23415 [Closterium sp. NIES-67]